jgi:2-hydroxychromene-2-carboxylate isomerase
VSSDTVAKCIDEEHFSNWVTAATNRATSDASLVNPAQGSFGTPTVLVDGKLWTGSTDLLAEING